MAKLVLATTTGILLATSCLAQGVPTVDPSLIIRNEASAAHREADIETQRESLTAEEQIAEIEEEQLSVLEQILEATTLLGGQNIGGMVNSLENGPTATSSVEAVYGPVDPNPAGAQMFGDAALNIEELIIQVAQETHGHSGVGMAGLSVVQWRCLLQAMIWQESRFTVGARSPVGAYGLTQIMPGTAGDLGIYPAYYDSPYLQVEGGARYLAQMLRMFDGNIIHALAAYNAGPGNVQNYGGVPPFQETQHYVQVIPEKYNQYLSVVGGIDALGTIDPVLLANSNMSMTGLGASVYGSNAMVSVREAALRLQNIVQRIGQTGDVQEAMALNTYARAELVRLIAARTRLSAAQAETMSAAEMALAAALLAENQYMDFTLEELE